ncbi:MAG: hypothetical protein U0905_04495 [Pirellulales bacterium]
MIKQNVLVRDVISEIERTAGIQLWLDRRLNPDRLVDFRITGTYDQAIQELSKLIGGEVAWIENVVYLAPQGEAAKIEAAYWRLFQAWPSSERVPNQSWSWKRATQPAEYLRTQLENQSYSLQSFERIDYDLWDAASLQDCSLPAKISLFLAGFDLSLSKDNKNLLVIPMSDDVEVSARTSSIRVTPSQKQAWAKLWPQAKAKSTKDTEWQITGPAKAHRDLLRPSNPNGKSTQRPTSNKKLSGKIQGPLGDLLRQLAEANQLQVEPWPLPEPIAGKRVDLQVENVTIEELFQRMAESTGTVIRVEGKSLKVQ